MTQTLTVKTLIIDGHHVAGHENETILQLALENGIYIPTLCHLEGLSDVGACRICVVEIKGSPKLIPACMTKIEEGMEVITNSERIKNYRLRTLELLFSERNHICSVCVSNGHCELQDLAKDLGLTHVSLSYRHPRLFVDSSHDRYVLDHNRCILCTRCVRVCDEVESAHTLDIMNRGVESRIIIDFNQRWGDSDTCTRCGKCVHICPTGALSEKGKSVAEMQKQREFLPYLQVMRIEHERRNE